MTATRKRLLDRKLKLAKLALLWEALWRAAFPALMIARACGAGGAHRRRGAAAGMAEAGGACRRRLGPGLVAAAAFALRMPDEAAALRRLEVESNLKHRPATAWRTGSPIQAPGRSPGRCGRSTGRAWPPGSPT
jgi:hypothetical protein